MELYHGNIVYSKSRTELVVHEDSYIAVENGLVHGIFHDLPGICSQAATREGGALFGNVGSFEEGCAFDALVIRDFSNSFRPLSPVETVERFCYTGNASDSKARFPGGKELA